MCVQLLKSKKLCAYAKFVCLYKNLCYYTRNLCALAIEGETSDANVFVGLKAFKNFKIKLKSLLTQDGTVLSPF